MEWVTSGRGRPDGGDGPNWRTTDIKRAAPNRADEVEDIKSY
jgi:hypothetical protein